MTRLGEIAFKLIVILFAVMLAVQAVRYWRERACNPAANLILSE